MWQDKDMERRHRRDMLIVNLWAAAVLGFFFLVGAIVTLAQCGVLP